MRIFIAALCFLALAGTTASSVSVASRPLPEGISVPTGVKQPAAKYQRYRRELYPAGSPFYEWWYFWLRDEETGSHWALYFDVSACGSKAGPCNNDGAFVMFDARLPANANSNAGAGDDGAPSFTKYERWPLAELHASKETQTVAIGGDASANVPAAFSIEVLDEAGDEIRVRGRMNNTARTWRCEGCDAALDVEWDFVVHRKFGWYGEHPFELPDRLAGVIMWNTYAHTSEVEGTLRVGDHTTTLERNSRRFRAYADMNWGVNFPTPPPTMAPDSPEALDYAWGWYYGSNAHEAASDDELVAVVAGTGLTYVDGTLLGSMRGSFFDVVIGAAVGGSSGSSTAPAEERLRVSAPARRVDGVDVTLHAEGELPVRVAYSGDGSLLDFAVDRSAWATLRDDRGVARIPLVQTVRLATTHHNVTMAFTSSIDDYRRLLFPRQGYVFSDFEALGATVTVTVERDGRVISHFTSRSGGLEFGYRVRDVGQRVAVLGGGVGGLTAAHELAARGFNVTVYEALPQFGGKARSFGARGTGTHGRRDLPAEHGFRIFAGEYGATRDTMKRIPMWHYPDGYARMGPEVPSVQAGQRPPQYVIDYMTMGTEALFTSEGGNTTFTIPSTFPHDKRSANETLRYIEEILAYLTKEELEFFSKRMWILDTTCMARRWEEFERVSWWDYMHTDDFSSHYVDLIKMVSGNILAANPKRASAHVVGNLALDLVTRTMVPGQKGILYMLAGATSDVWIDPWVEHLKELGVTFVSSANVTAIHVDGSSRLISGATVEHLSVKSVGGRREEVDADIFVAALPAEKAAPLFGAASLDTYAPSLKNVKDLTVAWMVGIQFFLRKDVPVINGNIGFLHSPWMLAGVSQTQFRPTLNLTEYGAGDVKGVISLTISNWTTPGAFVGKPAMECTEKEIIDEVWAQLKAWIPGQFRDSDLVTAYLDPDVTLGADGSKSNYLPLMVNTPNSYFWRPLPYTEIDNFYIASDYARAPINVACMETANSAARIAVNKILDRLNLTESPRCVLWPSEEEHMGEGFLKEVLAPFRAEDEVRFKEGKPHAGCSSAPHCGACMCEGGEKSWAAPPEAKALWQRILKSIQAFNAP